MRSEIFLEEETDGVTVCVRAQPTQQSISLTPTRGGAFTPQKLMLAQRERRMNMLSPGDGKSLFNADIETGKVVAEWSFQKDGVDVGMKDIVNETRAAQLDDRDTFLGLGTNRRAPLPWSGLADCGCGQWVANQVEVVDLVKVDLVKVVMFLS